MSKINRTPIIYNTTIETALHNKNTSADYFAEVFYCSGTVCPVKIKSISQCITGPQFPAIT
jgi:hypothetical protein